MFIHLSCDWRPVPDTFPEFPAAVKKTKKQKTKQKHTLLGNKQPELFCRYCETVDVSAGNIIADSQSVVVTPRDSESLHQSEHIYCGSLKSWRREVRRDIRSGIYSLEGRVFIMRLQLISSMFQANRQFVSCSVYWCRWRWWWWCQMAVWLLTKASVAARTERRLEELWARDSFWPRG